MVTPKGNPAGISDIRDLAKPGIKVILAPEASPPGGKAVSGLLKNAGVLNQVMKNTVVKGSCVQRTMEDLVSGKGDVSVVEKRLTRMPLFRGKSDIIAIPSKYYPAPPLTFTIGVMKHATDSALADHYVDFILWPVVFLWYFSLPIYRALCELPELSRHYVPRAAVDHVLGILVGASTVRGVIRQGILRLGLSRRSG
jgi:hypothetical protein